jgi:hypothetical protein
MDFIQDTIFRLRGSTVLYVIAAEVEVQIFKAGYNRKLMYKMQNQFAKILQEIPDIICEILRRIISLRKVLNGIGGKC